jgi:(p)ppGpp synthase/HD superfamily hydrolase
MLEEAIDLALEMHIGQTDKAGQPYILHLLRVMLAVQAYGEKYMIVGVLHDLAEDTDFSVEYVGLYGFIDEVVEAIDAITKRKDEPYEEYLTRVKLNLIAIRVKRADLKDNLNEDRLALLPIETRQRLREKYWKALDALSAEYEQINNVARGTKDV